MALQVQIDSRTYEVDPTTIEITEELNKRTTCSFALLYRAPTEGTTGNLLPPDDGGDPPQTIQIPQFRDEVIITDDTLPTGAQRRFGGLIWDVRTSTLDGGIWIVAEIDCVGFAAYLDQEIIAGFIRLSDDTTNWVDGTGITARLVARRLIDTWAAWTGITAADATATLVTKVQDDVYDYIPIGAGGGLDRLCEAANGLWDVDAYKRLVLVSAGSVSAGTTSLDEATNIMRGSRSRDPKDLVTVAIVIGNTPQRFSRVEEFTATAAQTTILLTLRIESLSSVSLNGTPEDSSGGGARWSVNTETATLTRLTQTPDGDSVPSLAAGDVIAVGYDYDLPVVATSESAAGIAAYGRIVRVIRDPSIDTLPDARGVGERYLARHAAPVLRDTLAISTPNADLHTGTSVSIRTPALRDPAVDNVVTANRLVERVTSRGLPDGRFDVGVEVVAADHEPTVPPGYYRPVIPGPSRPIGQPRRAGGRTIGESGQFVATSLGGSYLGANRETTFTRITGGAIARMNGDRLNPIVQWKCMVELDLATGEDTPAPSVELQLWRLDTPPVAASANVILVASTGGQLIPRHASSDDTRVTLAPSRYADYELRARLTAAPSDPTTTARVWAAEIVETEAL